MGGFLHGAAAAGRLEWGEVLRSRWLIATTLCYVGLGAVLIAAGTRESSVFGFTGMGRVLLSFAHLLLVVLPLLALSATVQLLPRAREDGTLELLFSQPLTRAGYLVGLTAARLFALLAPLVVVLLGMGAVGRLVFAEAIPWPMLGRALSVGTALLLCFTGLGLFVSVHTRGQAKAVVYGLLIWAAAVALVDAALLGVLLQWKLHPRVVFFLAALNPVQLARLGLLSGIDPDLTTLGPVGFYLTHTLGPVTLWWLGLCGPTGVGLGAWLLSARGFSRGDLV